MKKITVKEYAYERGYMKEDQVKYVSIERAKYLEENIAFIRKIVPEEGKLFVVVDSEGYVLEDETNAFKRIAELNKEKFELLKLFK